MYNGKKISVVIPCYNEEKGIGKVIPKLPKFIDEIIVIDNNSSDSTSEVAKSLGGKVIFEARKGYGRAYKTGLKAVEGDIIVTLDGDGTYPALAIPYLVDALIEEGLDFISARRIFKSWDLLDRRNVKEAVFRFIGNKVLSFATWTLFGCYLNDSQSGMWIFKKDVLSKVNVTSDGMPFSEELKIEVFKNKSFKSREVPIEFYYAKREGDSKLNLWGDGFGNLAFLFRKRFTKLDSSDWS